MNRELLRPIAAGEIRAYEEDGAVCIRGQFDRGWIRHMLEVVEANLENPAGTVLASGEDEPGRTIANSHMSRSNPAFMDFVEHSPAREIAARLMGLDEVRFFYDQLFVKDPGTRLPTAWHHDLPFWPLAGNHVASVWLALTPVTRETSGLVYVAGSHRWETMYRPVPAVPREGFALAEADALPDCPMFHREFDNPAYRFLSWDMEAGDCIVHHPLAVHGAGGNASPDIRRVALSCRFFGGDITWYGPRTRFNIPAPPRRISKSAHPPPTTACSPWCGGRRTGRRPSIRPPRHFDRSRARHGAAEKPRTRAHEVSPLRASGAPVEMTRWGKVLARAPPPPSS